MTFGTGVTTTAAIAWRNRLISAGAATAVIVALRLCVGDVEARGYWLYAVTVTIGYGHLLGAAIFARGRVAARLPGPPGITRVVVPLAVVNVFMLFLLFQNAEPGVYFPLLGLAAWHMFENDLLLGRAYANGFRIGRLPRRLADHIRAVAMTCAYLGLAGASLDVREAALLQEFFGMTLPGLLLARTSLVVLGGLVMWQHRGRPHALGGAVLVVLAFAVPDPPSLHLTIAEVAMAGSLYHIASWLVLFHDRRRALSQSGRSDAARSLGRRLIWIHALPVAVVLLLFAAPTESTSTLRTLILSPVIYLFWSLLHAVQTALVRGLDRGHPAQTPA